jgi:hypothetical protein
MMKYEEMPGNILRTCLIVGIIVAAILAIIGYAIQPTHASCNNIQRIAQDSANHMAHTGQYNHSWFLTYGRARGGLAENIAVAKTKSDAIRQWWGSPGHAENMRLSGSRFACKATAVACGRTCYAAMAIGEPDGAAKKKQRLTREFMW